MEKEMNDEELFIPKTKHKTLKIILAIILIGALIAGGYFLYKEKFCNPNKTVISILENTEKEVNNSFNDSKIYKYNGVLKINANLSNDLKAITDIINKLDLQFIMEADAKNKLVNATLNTKYKNEKLADVNLYVTDNTFYIQLQDIYDKYLKASLNDVTNEEAISSVNIDTDDMKVLSTSLMKAFKKSINDLEFKRTSTTIKIDDNDRNVYNNYVDLKEADIKKLANSIIDTLANDAEFTKVFKKLVASDNATISDLKDTINKATISGTYRLNFYTNKGLLNQKLVSIRFESINDDVKTTINFDKINDDETLLLIDTSGGTVSIRVKKTNSIFNTNINVNILGYSVKLDLSSSYEKIKEVTKPDIENSKKIEDLTEDEQKEIQEKLQNNKGLVNFIQDISK